MLKLRVFGMLRNLGAFLQEELGTHWKRRNMREGRRADAPDWKGHPVRTE